MKVICDTSSIIKLQRGGIIDCLGQLFEAVLIPQSVKEECRKPETKAVLQMSFFQIHTVSRTLPLSGIHIGELEAISLAVEHNIPVIILDDEKAFRRALEQGLTPLRSFRVLLLAKQKGLIPSVKSVLDEMISQGEGVQDDLYQKIMKSAGENPIS